MREVKVFISQPMKGLTDAEILTTRKKLEKRALDFFKGQNVIFVDSFIKETPPKSCCKYPEHKSLWYLGQSISKMAEADCVFKPLGCEDTNSGCKVEELCAQLYHLDRVCCEV